MDNTFIFFNTILNSDLREAIVFQEPTQLITCYDADQVEGCFRQLENALSEGFFAAGFLSYELGHHFMEIPFQKRSRFPLFCFGIYEYFKKLPVDKLIYLLSKKTDTEEFRIHNGSYSVPDDVYRQDVGDIRSHLEYGNTYQVNYTFKYKFDFAGSPAALFSALLRRQRVPYAGFFQMDDWALLSLSPELFFQRDRQEVFVRPMKGTIGRGNTPEEDQINSQLLADSVKDRAENIMIVDLLRNDLGKISETGSVKLDEMFSVEKYSTLFQMTSTVRSKVKKDITWHEFFREIFPSGSVTGAPKRSTMEIIKETEKEDRDIYTGSMGYITPGGQALFNVAIRTALIDRNLGKGELGIGSGIVYDSDAEKEYAECCLKGSFLTGMGVEKDFNIIETILWEKGRYFLLDLHLKRLEESARYFSYPLKREEAVEKLNRLVFNFDPKRKYRVRLLLDKEGKVAVIPAVLEREPFSPVKIRVSDKRTSKGNVFFRYKTTNRRLYDQELSDSRKSGFFEVLFLNDNEELTEGSITNLVIKKGDEFFTPPLSSGALGGVYREYLMNSGVLPIKEKVLHMEDLKNADSIYLINSVRKIIPAVL